MSEHRDTLPIRPHPLTQLCGEGLPEHPPPLLTGANAGLKRPAAAGERAPGASR